MYIPFMGPSLRCFLGKEILLHADFPLSMLWVCSCTHLPAILGIGQRSRSSCLDIFQLGLPWIMTCVLLSLDSEVDIGLVLVSLFIVVVVCIPHCSRECDGHARASRAVPYTSTLQRYTIAFDLYHFHGLTSINFCFNALSYGS